MALLGFAAAAGLATGDTHFERARRLCLAGGGVIEAAARATRQGWMDLPPAVAEAWGGSAIRAAGVQSRVTSDAQRFSVLMVYADPQDSTRHICVLEESPGEAERDRRETRLVLGIPPRRTEGDADVYVVGQLPDGTVVSDLSAAGRQRISAADGDYITVTAMGATANQTAQAAGRTMFAQGRISVIAFGQPDRLSRPPAK